jgi:hypothetical protein
MGWHADVTTTAPTPFALEVLKVQVLWVYPWWMNFPPTPIPIVSVAPMLEPWFMHILLEKKREKKNPQANSKKTHMISVPSSCAFKFLDQTQFVGLACYQGKDIVFRFIIEYSSLRDFGP